MTASRKSTDAMPLSSVIVAYAKAKGIEDQTKAGKLVRARLRANFANVVKLSPNVAKVKASANDGNRWPSLSRECVRDVLKLDV